MRSEGEGHLARSGVQEVFPSIGGIGTTYVLEAKHSAQIKHLPNKINAPVIMSTSLPRFSPSFLLLLSLKSFIWCTAFRWSIGCKETWKAGGKHGLRSVVSYAFPRVSNSAHNAQLRCPPRANPPTPGEIPSWSEKSGTGEIH